MSSASTGGTEGSSPASSPASAASLAMAAPKYGTLVPNRIFVGGISASTSEEELTQLFSSYGNVKAVKIISDRAGVSKGYGFVTFETEEEAKRLQRESECIVLRERKLNIAPAIKKQPFNRSFDGGSGSPPAVPTSTYYYTNGMGLTYQNGVTFYNAGAPAPGTPVAPPADPATIYQATGVFGPQAAAGHQTFAPMIYPCPAPSLYMPQQYQYSPVPYEPYYAGAGAAQYLYTTSSSQNNASGGANGSGSSSNGTGATSPSAGPPQPLPSLPPPHPTHHFYAPAAPPPHHHPPVPTGPPPQQMDHLYYPFAAGPPPPPTQHAPLGLADQQLLLYTTDAPCQQQSSTSDGQAVAQEDSCSSSSHSEQPHGETQAAQPSGTTAPLVSLMPVKFSMSGRYANYHPITIHTMNMHSPQQACSNDMDEFNVGQVHCRTIIYHPAAVYIPHTHASSYHVTSEVGSLLPTPLPTSSSSSSSSQQTLESSPKIPNFSCREHSKVIATSTQSNSYVKSQNMSIALIAGVHQTNFGKVQTVSSQSSHKYAGVDASPKYPINALPSTRMPPHAYNKRVAGSNMGSPSYASQRSEGYAFGNFQKSTNFGVSSNFAGQAYSSACGSGMRRTGNHQNHDHANSRRSLNYGQSPYYDCASSYKASVHCNVDQSNFSGNFKVPYSGSHAHFEDPHNDRANESYNSNQSDSQITASTVSQGSRNSAEPVMSDKSVSPPPAPYSPMTRPLPTLSPPAPQVQFYAPAQNRYQPPLPPLQHQPQQQQQQQQQQQPPQQQQQQQPAQRRYTVAPPLPTGRKPSEKYISANSQNSILRQTKYKVNGIMQSGGKVSDDSLGGAGDAPPGVGRMPLTPPGTPRTHPSHSASEQNQLSDACHQMQALSL